jgi:NTE family protein
MEWTGEADGVFRGGGVKGLGLAGALEAFGTHRKWPVKRWVNVAGASAGAIIAAYLAYEKSPDVGKKISALLDPERLAAFQDFPLHRKYLGGVPSLLLKHGMAPGKAFERWFDGVLAGSTFTIAKTNDDWAFSRLKLIACDVTNRKLIVLPEDLPKYRELGRTAPIDPGEFKISRATRMSMSIPYFFEPIELELVRDGQGNSIPPRPATIVDGGTLSNFPVWIFDVAEPKRPTFGFTLKGGSGVGAGFNRYARLLPWFGRFALDIFHTAQEAWDERFMTHSTKVRTFAVDATVAGPDGRPHPVNTTDFRLSKQLQEQLIQNGRNAANEFLDRFDVSQYMNTLHVALPTGSYSDLAPTL